MKRDAHARDDHADGAASAGPPTIPWQFYHKRLMSLLGVFPLTLYVLAHLWTNLSALGGPQAYDAALIESRRHPAFVGLEVLLGVAILYHAGVGVRLMLRWRMNNLEQRHFRNLKFFVQRLSGIGLLIMIVAHVIKARIQPALTPAGRESWQGMHEAMSEPVTLTVYVLMLVAVSYHIANGLWTFLITWGVTITPRAQRVSQWLSMAVFIALLGISGLALYGFLQPFEHGYAQVVPR